MDTFGGFYIKGGIDWCDLDGIERCDAVATLERRMQQYQKKPAS